MSRHETLMTLAYAVRGRVVLKYLAQLALVLAALTAVPLLVALVYGETAFAWRLLLILVLLLAYGVMFVRLAAPARLQINEALVITALAFVLTALLMSYPLMAAGLSFADALFEAVSGVTTTGLSTLTEVEERSPAFLFIRAWMQWYGGLGIVVLSVALLAGHKSASRRLIEPEQTGESLITATHFYARRMLIVYMSMTIGGIALLLATGLDGFAAVIHVLAGISTGGFSSYDNSIAAMPLSAQAMVTLIAACGAVALPLYYLLFMQGPGKFLHDVELRALVLLLVLISALLTLALWGEGWTPAASLQQGMLLGFSAQSTTGFASMQITELGAFSKAVLLLAMVSGGSLGSTAGGIKLMRLLIVWRLLVLAVKRTSLAEHAVAEPRLGGRHLDADECQRALLVVLMFLLVVGLSWLPFLWFGYDPLDALFEVVSATGTVGLSTGISSGGLSPLLKGVLCFDMLAGRVEILALLVVLYPGSWFGKRVE